MYIVVKGHGHEDVADCKAEMEWRKNSWTRQPSKLMSVWSNQKMHSTLGMVVVDMPRSVRPACQGAGTWAYAGERSVEMVKRMVRFPTMVTKYMDERNRDPLVFVLHPRMPWRRKKEGWPWEALQSVMLAPWWST